MGDVTRLSVIKHFLYKMKLPRRVACLRLSERMAEGYGTAHWAAGVVLAQDFLVEPADAEARAAVSGVKRPHVPLWVATLAWRSSASRSAHSAAAILETL